MRISSFLERLSSLPGDPSDYWVYLAEPVPSDTGSDNVALVPVVKVDWDESTKAARLWPELPDGLDETIQGIEELVDTLPPEWEATADSRLQVQVPIVRTEGASPPLRYVDLHDIVIGPTSKEIWLLAIPRDDFKQVDWPA